MIKSSVRTGDATVQADDGEDGLVLEIGFFLGIDPDSRQSDRIFGVWERTGDLFRRDPGWAAWWHELGDRTVELNALLDVQPGLKRRFWSRAVPTPAITVTAPAAEVETAADLETYFLDLRRTIWQRIATKCQWPAPPDRLPTERHGA